MITGNTGTAQLPMKKRAENVLAELVKRRGIRRHFIDKKVVDYMLKKGLVKIERHGSHRTSHSVVVPVNMPEPEEPRVAEPYAKRKAALDEAGLNYRGKKKEEEVTEDLKAITKTYYFEIPQKFVCRRTKSVIKPGVYLFEQNYSSISIEFGYKASRIWGVTEDGKVFYVKQRATNPKKGTKVNMKDFAWAKLKAVKV